MKGTDHKPYLNCLAQTIKCEFETRTHGVVFKTTNKLSTAPFNLAHELQNKIVKGPGGEVGLTKNRMLPGVRCFQGPR